MRDGTGKAVLNPNPNNPNNPAEFSKPEGPCLPRGVKGIWTEHHADRGEITDRKGFEKRDTLAIVEYTADMLD